MGVYGSAPYQPAYSRSQEQPSYDSIDPYTAQLLKRANTAYTNTTNILGGGGRRNSIQEQQQQRMGGRQPRQSREEDNNYGWPRPEPSRKPAAGGGSDPNDSMMSTKTRSLLNSLKASTSALEGMQDDEPEQRQPARRTSRYQCIDTHVTCRQTLIQILIKLTGYSIVVVVD